MPMIENSRQTNMSQLQAYLLCGRTTITAKIVIVTFCQPTFVHNARKWHYSRRINFNSMPAAQEHLWQCHRHWFSPVLVCWQCNQRVQESRSKMQRGTWFTCACMDAVCVERFPSGFAMAFYRVFSPCLFLVKPACLAWVLRLAVFCVSVSVIINELIGNLDFSFLSPRSGVLRTQKLKIHLLRTQSSKVLSF